MNLLTATSQAPGLLRSGSAAPTEEQRLVHEARTVYFALDGVIADLGRAAAAAEVSLAEYRQLPAVYLDLPVFADTRDALARTAALGYALACVIDPLTAVTAEQGDRLRWLQRHYPALPLQQVSTAPEAWGETGDVLVDAGGTASALAANFRGLVTPYRGRWNEVLDSLRKAAAVGTASASAEPILLRKLV